MSIYQGYQGISNRTFVDPDLLAGVDIRKGSDASSRGVAGAVAMRTLSADDVVKPGEKWGVRVKSGFGTNTRSAAPNTTGGYLWAQPTASNPDVSPTASASGMDRPGSLDPTSGSASVVAAVKEENYDILWGYAVRKQGNYYAGKNGPSAQPVGTGPRTVSGIDYINVYENAGITNYLAGEQVLNTHLETQSWIAKATVRDDNGQSLQVGYNGYRSRAGDTMASLFTSAQSQPRQQAQDATTDLDTATVRYRWNPDDNDLVDLRANFWITTLKVRTPPRSSFVLNLKPEDYGLPFNHRPGNDSSMWGSDVTNKSRFGSPTIGDSGIK